MKKIWQNRKAFTDQHGSPPLFPWLFPFPEIQTRFYAFPKLAILESLLSSICGFVRLIVGYELLFLDANSFEISKQRHPVWSKFKAIELALNQFPHVEWIWWLDLDALIMTPSLELYDYLLGPEAMGGGSYLTAQR